MQIGEPQKEGTITPLSVPVPEPVEIPAEAPVEIPEYEEEPLVPA
jgi:hypothetical protein